MASKSTCRAYCRGSLLKQVITLGDQAERCKAYYDKNLAETCDWGGFHSDKATSSGVKLADRPHGASLIASLRPGDHLVCTNFDRLFRNFSEAAHWIGEWDAKGVIVHVIVLGINSSTVGGKIMLRMFAVFAELERILIRERTASSMKHVKRRPDQLKNGKPPLGFTVAGQKGHRKLIPDEQEQAILEQIVRKRDVEGLSFDQLFWAFKEANIRTRAGELWSRARIVRGYKAGKKLGKGKAMA